jgi:hypothetical protein
MPDAPIIHVSENSPEQVAYKLLREIASIEKKKAFGASNATDDVGRKWLLDTYAECLLAVRLPASRKNGDQSPVRAAS